MLCSGQDHNRRLDMDADKIITKSSRVGGQTDSKFSHFFWKKCCFFGKRSL